MMTERQVKEKCIAWASNIWGLEFDLPINFSGRMTRTLGYYRYRKLGSKIIGVKLQFAKDLFNGHYKEDTIDSVILHELCHWALSQLDKPFSDGHPTFEKELRRIGASSTRTISNAGQMHIVKCACCGKTAAKVKSEKKAINYTNPKYFSKCCKSKLVYGGVEIKEDTYERKEAMCASIENSIRDLQINKINNIPSSQPIKTQITLIIQDIFDTNERMTNAKMETLLKDLIINGESEKIKVLKDTYEVTFNRALKYLGSKRNEQIKKLVG